jgi:hypothetical protein
MPQTSLQFGFEYRDPSYWFINPINYVADNYLDFSPILRTNRFYTNPTNGFPFLKQTEERGAALLKQEKFNVFYFN